MNHIAPGVHHALTAANAGIWEWNLQTHNFSWSPESHRLYGIPEIASPSYAQWLECIHPGDRAVVHEAFDGVAEGHKEQYRCEFRVHHPQRDDRWVVDIGRLVRGLDGAPICMAGISLDVTNRKEAECAARSADTFRDEFIAILAHEMRNAITPIICASALLERGVSGPDRIKTQRIVARQASHLRNLTNDLLDLSSIKHGKLTLSRSWVDLRSVLQQALELAQPLIEEKGHHLQIDLPTRELMVNADARRLVQVFSNLMLNAAKYTPAGGHLQLRASCGPQGGAIVEVEDDGIGIDPSAREGVFDMFMQVAPASGRGLGLGLAIARRIVELHGGQVEARSQGLGMGAVFLVALP